MELSFKTGEVILVYGEMDEDGFFMGELDGVRGLVPSNFLTEAPEQYNNQSGGPVGMNAAQRNVAGRGRAGPGPGPGGRINFSCVEHFCCFPNDDKLKIRCFVNFHSVQT